MWWIWIVWAGIGLLCGFFAGNFLPGRRIVLADLIIGTLGALVGGWASAHAMGDGTPQMIIISMLVSLFVAGALLWIVGTLYVKLDK